MPSSVTECLNDSMLVGRCDESNEAVFAAKYTNEDQGFEDDEPEFLEKIFDARLNNRLKKYFIYQINHKIYYFL